MENYLPKWGVQILNKTLLDRMYILCFDYKKHYWKNSIFYHIYVICLLKSYWNVYRKSCAKHQCHDENVFLKADRALSELNFRLTYTQKQI